MKTKYRHSFFGGRISLTVTFADNLRGIKFYDLRVDHVIYDGHNMTDNEFAHLNDYVCHQRPKNRREARLFAQIKCEHNRRVKAQHAVAGVA